MDYDDLMKICTSHLSIVEKHLQLDASSNRTRLFSGSRPMLTVYNALRYDFHNGIIDRLPLTDLHRQLGFIEGIMHYEGLW